MHSTDSSRAYSALAVVLKTSTLLHFHEIADQAKVPAAVFTQTSPSARSQRTDARLDQRCCRNETAQPYVGLQANCAADRSGIRRRHRQTVFLQHDALAARPDRAYRPTARRTRRSGCIDSRPDSTACIPARPVAA